MEDFFPGCPAFSRPGSAGSLRVSQNGLECETDVLSKRYLAKLITQQGEEVALRPAHHLFNGGVLKSQVIHNRLAAVIGGWFVSETPKLHVGNDNLDLAVVRGAAYYWAVKGSGGMRIRGGHCPLLLHRSGDGWAGDSRPDCAWGEHPGELPPSGITPNDSFGASSRRPIAPNDSFDASSRRLIAPNDSFDASCMCRARSRLIGMHRLSSGQPP